MLSAHPFSTDSFITLAFVFFNVCYKGNMIMLMISPITINVTVQLIINVIMLENKPQSLYDVFIYKKMMIVNVSFHYFTDGCALCLCQVLT